MIDVPYVPGPSSRSVTEIGQKDVTHEYRHVDSRAGTNRRSRRVAIDWNGHGILAVVAALAVAVLADGATLTLIAWLQR